MWRQAVSLRAHLNFTRVSEARVSKGSVPPLALPDGRASDTVAPKTLPRGRELKDRSHEVCDDVLS
jgi:hypothetical protein